MPIETLFTSIGMIVLTELADKTMLTALCLSAQYRNPYRILLATMLALITTSIIAVVIGVILATTLPVDIIIYLSGGLFIVLGIYTLVNNDSDEIDSCEDPGTMFGIFSLILLSELGDKSQITTLALTVQSIFPIMVLIGAIIGFFIVNGIGVFLGDRLAAKIPISTVKKIAGIIFVVFGFLIIFGIL
jgi:putative Ca2+/H+ antiporter (TMEM165/GDT1 family)